MATTRSNKLLADLMDLVVTLGPGARLPDQWTLGKQYNSSRTLIRECIAIMEYLQIVTVRAKLGTTINPLIEWTSHRSDVLAWCNKSFVLHANKMDEKAGAI